MKKYILYEHINKINNKKYIGITSQENPKRRWQNGKGYVNQPKFYRAIQKYGWDNFEHNIIAVQLSKDMASFLEKFYIKYYNTITNGYNSDEGGVVTCHSKETRQKIAEANKKRIITKEMKENMSKGQRGNNNRGKTVRCVETGVIYPSAQKAALAIGLSGHSGIAACCRKVKDYKTAGGYHWEYV